MLFLVLFTVLVIFLITGRHLLYFRSDVHKLPGPQAWPLVGSALNFMPNAEQVIPLLRSLQEQYGNFFIIWFGLIPVINIINPTGAEAVLTSKSNISKGRAYTLLEPWLGLGLLTSTGSRWFSHRRLITPTFHFAILEQFLCIFQDNAKILVESLLSYGENPVELHPYITRCTMDVISEAAMGVKVNAQKHAENIPSNDALSTVKYMESIFKISKLTTQRIMSPWLRSSLVFFRTKKGEEYMENLAVVHGFANSVISTRKAAGPDAIAGKRLAFLDLLLEARDQDGNPLSEQDIREEVDTFMFEGHDTTSASLFWTLYLLGKHPDIQEKIYQELQEIFEQDSDRSITMADLASMKKLERAIKESLRLYPSVPNVVRSIKEDIEIDGYRIPKGSSLILHIYQLHRDPVIYPDPEKFDPDRFLPENSSSRHPFAYLPFSAGPRNCIGQKFALLEEKVILSEILRSYQVRFLGEMDPNKIRSELILRPPKGSKVLLRRRS